MLGRILMLIFWSFVAFACGVKGGPLPPVTPQEADKKEARRQTKPPIPSTTPTVTPTATPTPRPTPTPRSTSKKNK